MTGSTDGAVISHIFTQGPRRVDLFIDILNNWSQLIELPVSGMKCNGILVSK